ncbi:MAG: alpha-L-fucosidase [Chlorobi bacterium]|nr:alpha-L-fucosidase [Chlorobiota bacterium]
MKAKLIFQTIIIFIIFYSCQSKPKVVLPPDPYGPVPDERQLNIQSLEFYGFLHFSINTFTGRQWGFGNESPELFNPTDFNADQIVKTMKAGGMRGVILTAKHHDGFCLWPSAFTEHSVKNSPWKNGKGDVVREISDACHRNGMAFGIYLSPWDRNHPDYGRPQYVKYYQNQLDELLSNYGEIFTLWCDGANGGSGYYGGANEVRKIDNTTYYDWDYTWKIAYDLQPKLSIFSDVGPGTRWVGNERGHAGDPCWARFTPVSKNDKMPAPGNVDPKYNYTGQIDGKYWIPAEADVSIRPNWFYIPQDDSLVKSPEYILGMYYETIGHGATFNLNVPPDKRGQIHKNDSIALIRFKKLLDEIFDDNLAKKAKIKASNVRGNSEMFSEKNLTDGNKNTYWSTDNEIKEASLTINFNKPVTFNVIDLREYTPLGQRVWDWAFDKWDGSKWIEFAKGRAIGLRRLWRSNNRISTKKIRLRFSGPVCPAISELGVYAEPVGLTVPPVIKNN